MYPHDLVKYVANEAFELSIAIYVSSQQFILHLHVVLMVVIIVSVSPVSPCALIFCANGFRCEVSGGEGFCQPDCSLNNGGCLKDETCRLEDVTCVTTPCPKSRICDKPPTTPPCPPTCTKDFCRRRGNRKALCSK